MEFTSLTDEGKAQMSLLVFVLTCILPSILLLTCRFLGIVKNLRLSQKDERYIPGILMMLTYGVSAWFFEFRLNLPAWLSEPMFVMFGSAVMFLFVNIFMKVSVYAWGVFSYSGLLAWIVFNTKDYRSLLFLILSIILSGGVMSARMYLERHTPRQLWTGALTGISVGMLVAYLSLK